MPLKHGLVATKKKPKKIQPSRAIQLTKLIGCVDLSCRYGTIFTSFTIKWRTNLKIKSKNKLITYFNLKVF